MRAVLQRVERASVKVAGEEVGAIGPGVLVLVAAEIGDGPNEVDAIARKLAVLRFFEDADGKMNLDAQQAGAAFLVVSQFTLAATLRKGRRPSFDRSARPGDAEPLVDSLVDKMRDAGFEVATGRFGAMMKVSLVNDGPVTFVLDAKEGKIL